MLKFNGEDKAKAEVSNFKRVFQSMS